MKRIALRTPERAFEYVLEHYYCFQQRECCLNTERYAVISIQDTGGAGYRFTESEFCCGVLTLCFDNITDEVPGKRLFDDALAEQIIDFVLSHRDAETLLLHCDDSCERARAAAACITEMFGGDSSAYFTRSMNQYVYDVLDNAWFMRQLRGE